jgi:MFS family permease
MSGIATPILPIATSRSEMRRVIIGSSLGTAFEWYDFFLYAFLAVFFSALFFPKGSETAGLLASLATFGAGFVVRPLGALAFGALGDRLGRKYTFLMTIIVMGFSTALIGFIPSFASIGWAAPVLLVMLRLLQGFSLGGEYSGAATYAVEYAARHRRGAQTGWLQVTPSFGQIAAIGAILACRTLLSAEDFASWGWRIPFMLSLPFLVISIYIRRQLHESPVFNAMKQAGKQARAPLAQALGDRRNLGIIFVAFAICAAEGTALYTGQLHSFYFIQTVLKLDPGTASLLEGLVIVAAMPTTLALAWLSDIVGRKRVLLCGALVAALALFPVFHGLTHFANPALESFDRDVRVTLAGEACSVPLLNFSAAPQSQCAQAATYLNRQGVNYRLLPPDGSGQLVTQINQVKLTGFQQADWLAALKQAGWPERADPAAVNRPMVFVMMFLLSLFGLLLWAPLSVFLVEQFAAPVRYTSVSVSANLGSGWFGGMTPFLITALSLRAGNMYQGLWLPVSVCAVAFVIGLVGIRDKTGRDIQDF